MREIKFRAWDKNNTLVDIETSKPASMLYDVGLSINFSRLFPDERAWFIYEGKSYIPADDKDFVLMQFTGKKDINGKEIYEGDIVKTSQGLGQVLYSEQQMMFYIEGQFGPASDQDLEVVGNIYENPKLLAEIEIIKSPPARPAS